MAALEALRRRTLGRLHDAYAAGQLSDGTLEHRLELALEASCSHDLDSATWDLPTIGASLWQSVHSRVAHHPAPARCHRLLFGLPRPLSLELGEQPRSWLIGRSSECDVVLSHPLISRRHALLSTRGDRCAIRDLDSANGVTVNGRRVSTAVLQPGDELTFGEALNAAVR